MLPSQSGLGGESSRAVLPTSSPDQRHPGVGSEAAEGVGPAATAPSLFSSPGTATRAATAGLGTGLWEAVLKPGFRPCRLPLYCLYHPAGWWFPSHRGQELGLGRLSPGQQGNAPCTHPDQHLPGLGNGLGALPPLLPTSLPDQSMGREQWGRMRILSQKFLPLKMDTRLWP